VYRGLERPFNDRCYIRRPKRNVMRRFAFIVALLVLVFSSCKKDEEVQPTSPPTGGVGNSELAAPQLYTPSNNATGLWTPLYYSWSEVPGADGYEFKAWYFISGINAQYGFSGQLNLASPSYAQTTSLGENGGWHGMVIYWKVRAHSGTGSSILQSQWSEVHSFTLL